MQNHENSENNSSQEGDHEYFGEENDPENDDRKAMRSKVD